MNIVPIIQARMSSSRLPGKILQDLAGRPMIWHVVDRARKANVGEVILATSNDSSDDPVAAFCDCEGVLCFRGNLTDLLDRYYHAALSMHADAVVRLTGDCPLLDPEVIRQTVDLFRTGAFDYVSNFDPPTFPDGLDTEVFSFTGLERGFREAKLPSEREHVAPYFTNHPEIFKRGNLAHDQNQSHLRWTVDEPRDMEFARRIFGSFEDADFGMKDVLRLLQEQPELLQINQGIIRNAGHASALKADEEFLRAL